MCEQLDLFNCTSERFKITKPIRLIELFAGYGSQYMALKRLQDEGLCKVESWKVVEFDKHVINSYNVIHGTEYLPKDIREIKGNDLRIEDTESFTYLLTYSFPCQDLSNSGNKKGMSKGSGTRSGLLWEVERLLNETDNLPQVLMMENVTQVHSKKNIDDFNMWLHFLESKGYKSYYKDLNAKDFGIPQNRNRTFMISVLGDYTYEFPKGFELTRRMVDFLEDEVDESYFLDQKTTDYYIYHSKECEEKGYGFRFKPKERNKCDKAFAITTKSGGANG